MAREKRRFARIGLPVGLSFRPESGRRWLPGTLTDLSAGGLRFVSPAPLEDGSRVEFRITLPVRAAPYECAGVVLWEHVLGPRNVECGAAFVGVSAAKQAQLDQLVVFVGQRRG